MRDKLTEMTTEELKYACKNYAESINTDNLQQNGVLYIPIDIWRNQNENILQNKLIRQADELMNNNVNLSVEDAVDIVITNLISEFFMNIQKQYNCIIIPFKVTTNTFHCNTFKELSK